MYHFTSPYTKKLNSKLTLANSWHSPADSLTSILTLIGLIGVSFDKVRLAALAALIVALFVAKIALTFLWEASQVLLDTALPLEQRDAFRPGGT